MSNYRDDTQETAVAASSTWAGIASLTEEIGRASTSLAFGLMILHAGTALAADQVVDRAQHLITEQAVITEQLTGHLHAGQLVNEQRSATDLVIGRLRVLHTDTVTTRDEFVDSSRAVVTEIAVASDQVLAARKVVMLVSESARLSDITGQVATALIEDLAVITDACMGALRARITVSEACGAADSVIEARQAAGQLTDERGMVSAAVLDHLVAFNLVAESAEALDTVLDGGAGQAWTANVDSWAMSRYAPYDFTGLAVIDGKLYGTAEDGVYDLGIRGEVVSGEIRTGKLDVSSAVLSTPHCAYLEYELNGTAEMDVTTTQSGAAETYTYGLPPELAGELTNGRFVFGRGFRGRHFTFALRLTGTHGYINDLSVSTAQTKRRV